MPPETQAARSTANALWATSWSGTSAAQGTLSAGATQTMQSLGVECFSCYSTDACSSGWARQCFYTGGGLYFPLPRVCQSAAECEPRQSKTEPECVPGSAWGADTPLDPCKGWDWTWDLFVLADVPPHIVQVDPFPRWIVGMGAPLPAPYESGSPGTLTLQDYPALSNFAGVCQPNWDGEGCWSGMNNKPDPIRTGADGKEAPALGDIKGFRVGLRWRRIDILPSPDDLSGAPAICWDWDEREWNIGKNYGYGPISNVSCGKSVSHIYETSSWGKPKNGPNFIPAEDTCTSWTPVCKRASLSPSEEARCHCCEQIPGKMDDWRRSGYPFDPDLGPWQNPAYQVKVPTYWALEWAAEWWQWEQIGNCNPETCGCRVCEDPRGCRDLCECHGSGDLCTGENEFCGCEPEYGWKKHNFTDRRWNLVDLRNYEWSTWYYTSYAVRTTGEYPGCAFEYGDPNPGTTVRVPVIEVQSVLRDPCILDGSCP